MDYTATLVTTLAACVVAIVTTTISAWIAVPFALRRFRKERRWERKEEAYGRVLHSLAHLKDYLDVNYEAALLRKEIHEEIEADLRAKARQARKEIKVAVDLRGFLLSTEARERLARFQSEDDDASNEKSWFEYLDASLAAAQNCLEDLTEIAARDLN